MDIEQLKALSPFCWREQLVTTRTKTKLSQPVSLSVLGRQLQQSQYPQKIPQLCVTKNHAILNCMFQKRGDWQRCEDNAQGTTGKQKTLLKGSKFYLSRERQARGLMVIFLFQVLAQKKRWSGTKRLLSWQRYPPSWSPGSHCWLWHCHRDAFSCSQLYFVWWTSAVASKRNDGTIWWEETTKRRVILLHIEPCVHSNGQAAGHYW